MEPWRHSSVALHSPSVRVSVVWRVNVGNPPGKLADAELHFIDGELDGLKLIGFAIWERRGGNGHNVTFPARQYGVSGDGGANGPTDAEANFCWSFRDLRGYKDLS